MLKDIILKMKLRLGMGGEESRRRMRDERKSMDKFLDIIEVSGIFNMERFSGYKKMIHRL
jgi:hypothetical protein